VAAIAAVQGGGYVLDESACCEYSFPDTIEARDTAAASSPQLIREGERRSADTSQP